MSLAAVRRTALMPTAVLRTAAKPRPSLRQPPQAHRLVAAAGEREAAVG